MVEYGLAFIERGQNGSVILSSSARMIELKGLHIYMYT